MPLYPEPLDELVRRLEQRVQQLEAKLGQRGPVNVVQGGTLNVLQDDGTAVAQIGDIGGQVAIRLYYPDGSLAFYSGMFPDGRVETVMYRDDGSTAFRIGGALGQPQFFAGYDRSGNIVLSDDTTSTVGIATPYIPAGAFQSNSAPADTTTSGAFTTLQTAQFSKMNPRIAMQILARASDGATSGEVRVVDEDGVQIGGTITVAAGAFQYYSIGPVPVPGAFKESKSLNLQARVTGGTGSIGVRGIFAEGRQS